MYNEDRLYLIKYIHPNGDERTEEYLAEDAEEAISMLESCIGCGELTILDVFMKLNGSWNAIEDSYDGQPDEYTEWMDYDPDC